MKKFKFAAVIIVILLFATALSACTQKTEKSWSFVSDGKIIAKTESPSALPVVTNKEGYLFYGWFLADGTQVTEEFLQKNQSTSSLTAYAKWERHTHQYEQTAVAPTCTGKGYTRFSCTCGETYDEEGEAALGHEFSEEFTVDTESTCITPGMSSRRCERCDEKTDLKELPLSDHKYDSLYDDKMHWRKCSMCDARTDAVSHSFSWVIDQAPNCIVKGLQHEFCACGMSRNENTAVDIVKHPSCDTSWQTDEVDHWKYCSVVKQKFYQSNHTYISGICSTCEKLNKSNAPTFNLINDDKEYEISGGELSDASIVIPETYLGKPVTAIADKAFENFSTLKSVTLNQNIKRIGDEAFKNCFNLSIVETAATSQLLEIGKDAFYGAVNLQNAVLTAGIKSLGEFAYANSGIAEVAIPASLQNIGVGAFAYCKNLSLIAVNDQNKQYRAISGCLIDAGAHSIIAATSSAVIPQDAFNTIYLIAAYAFAGVGIERISVPESVTSIGEYAFDDCKKLSSLNLSARVASIGFGAFRGCVSMGYIVLPYVGAERNAQNETIVDESENETIVERVHFGYVFGAKSYKNNAQFVPSNLKNIIISGGTSIEDYAFFGCQNILSIELPGTVTKIGEEAFAGCVSILEFTVLNAVKSIGASAFSGCNALEVFNVPFVGASRDAKNGNVINADGIETYVERIHFGYIFGAKSVDSQNDYVPQSLRKVVITDTETIGDKAFFGLSTLQFVEFSAKLATIGKLAFSDCARLSSVTFQDNSKLTLIGDFAFKNCAALLSLSVPTGITRIGFGALEGCNAIKNLVLPFIGEAKSGTENTHLGYLFGVLREDLIEDFNNIGVSEVNSAAKLAIPVSLEIVTLTGGTIIGDYAFYGATRLRAVRIPGGILNIGKYAFYGCGVLTEIILPDSLKSIADGAFGYCTALFELVIPKSVNLIGEGITRYCQSLARISVHNENKLFFVKENCLIERSTKKLIAGCKTSNITTSADFQIVEIGHYAFGGMALKEVFLPSTLLTIGDCAFIDCSTMTKITFPSSIIKFGQNVLSGCTQLTSVTLPFLGEKKDAAVGAYLGYFFGAPSAEQQNEFIPSALLSVTLLFGAKVAGDAFYGCGGLQSVVLDGTESIGEQAFYGCYGLTEMNLPSTVASIGQQAFYGCYGLLNISFRESLLSQKSNLAEVGAEAFMDCRNLTSVILPATLTTLGERSFYGCDAITDVVFENASKLASLSEGTFGGCVNLESVNFGDNSALKSLSMAFLGCLKLKTVVFGLNSVLNLISASAFSGCKALTDIVLPQSVTSIGWGAFADCSSLVQIMIPPKTLYLGGAVFERCTSLKSVFDFPVTVDVLYDNTFAFCGALSSISYLGTTTEWGKIQKSGKWDANVSGFMVVCTDGNIMK